MAFSGYRDVKQKREKELAQKQDKQAQFRAVVTDENGLQSGNGSIWANQNKRRVWIMPVGGVQPFQVICVRLTPVIGLGVIVGYADPLSKTLEVLRTDYEFLLESNTLPTAFESPSNEDFLPGGRLQLWLTSKLLQPLATYPQNTGLIVNVTSGYYPYAGVRTFYNGAINLTLTQNPNAGEHYFAGLYLDNANTLQVVYGASVSVATAPPEPTWPDGAFQLCVVRINDTQTRIIMAQDTDSDNDIFDRRMLWADIDSFGGGWPFSGILTVSSTDPDADYTTIGDAITAASAGNAILLDTQTFTETVTVSKNVTIFGFGATINSASAATVTITSQCKLLNLTITNSASGALAASVKVDGATSVILERVTVSKTSGTPTIGAAIWTEDAINLSLRDCVVSCSAGTSRYGIYNDPNFSSIIITGGSVSGTTNSINGTEATSILLLRQLPSLSGSISFTSTDIHGEYTDSNTNLIFVNASGMSGGVWLQDASAGLKLYYTSTSLGAALIAVLAVAATGDIITLEAGTYTLASGQTISTSGISIVADSPGGVTITNATASSQAFNVTGDNVTFRNLTITHTGTGTTSSVIAFDGDNLTIDNCILTKTGAASLGNALYAYGGAGAKVINSTLVSSGATTNYGFYNTIATTSIEFRGGSISGSTRDIWGDITASTLATYGTILVNNTVEWSGIYPRYNIQPLPIESIMLNGHPLIWQRGTSFAAAANGAYSADRWKYGKSGAMVHTLSRSTDVPTIAQVGSLLQYSVLADVTTADASIAAGDHAELIYTIEGFNFLQIAQQQFTFPIWIKATKTGIYCLAFRNSVADRSYVAEVTVNTTATWEYKQVTVAASPSAGTWDYANGAGLFVSLALACGSTFQTTAGAWQTGNFLGTANQVNACDDVANDTRVIFGQPIPGPYARPIEIARIDNVLDYCQRYYQKSYDLATAPGTNTANGAPSWQTRTAIAATTAGVLRPGPLVSFSPRLRSQSGITMVAYSTDGTANAVRNDSGANNRTGATITASIGERGFRRIEIDNSSANAITADQVISFHWTADNDF